MYLLREILSVCIFVRSEKINQISKIRIIHLKIKHFRVIIVILALEVGILPRSTLQVRLKLSSVN